MKRILLTVASVTFACLFAAARSPGPDSLSIALAGSCPGRVTMHWEGAMPDSLAGLLFSRSRGNYTMNEPCPGTVLGLGTSGLRLVRYFRTGLNGAGELSGTASPLACGGYLQMVVADGLPCTTSNVAQIPQ